MPPTWDVYTITGPTCRVYVGSKDADQRYRQHARTPPRRMAADANLRCFQPFEAHFTPAILRTNLCYNHAHDFEPYMIRHLQARRPAGYNVLSGAPGRSGQFYYIDARQRRCLTEAEE